MDDERSSFFFVTIDAMKEILFATTNARKIIEANGTLATFHIRTMPISIEIDEIQHHDPAVITKAKARAAYAVLQQPVVVSDTSWDVPALGGFPGGYMKDVAAWWSEDDWLSVMARHDNKAIYCLEHLAYFDGKNLQHFSQVYTGTFLAEARGPAVNPAESFERVISLNGTESLTEQVENGNFDIQTLGHWVQLAQWLNSQD